MRLWQATSRKHWRFALVGDEAARMSYINVYVRPQVNIYVY